ncbi:response regulator [Paenibacillus sp. sgz302251]|uniref:response regulator n=1 Tax=Paenibacillus sp. sgz302251 TaxID=3414493 RepID=UPI003C7E8F8D
MKVMKVIIIDDEKAMHLIMRRLLAKFPNVEIVGSFQDTDSASLFLNDHAVHMAFVDISMPQEGGLRFAKRMSETGRNLHIVFVTSHKEYAMDAFDLFALDYIVKPVSLERLEKTVRRAAALHQFSEAAQEVEHSNRASIYCLGGLEVRSGQGDSVKWMTRKSAELFGYLLLHRGRMVSRARLTEDVFAGMPSKNAETYLNTTVYQLRKSLEPHGLKSLVKSSNDSYGMDISNAYIDIVEFEDKLKRFALIDGSNLEEAIAVEELFTGELFGEKSFLWALNDMERLSRMYAVFVKKIASALLKHQEGDSVAVAVRLLLKLLARNALDEETVRMLLVAYSAQKDRGSLTRQYNQYVRLLRQELGIGPSQEVIVLYSRLRSSLEGAAVK